MSAWATDESPQNSGIWDPFFKDRHGDAFSEVFTLLDFGDMEVLSKAALLHLPLHHHLQNWREGVWKGMLTGLPFPKPDKGQKQEKVEKWIDDWRRAVRDLPFQVQDQTVGQDHQDLQLTPRSEQQPQDHIQDLQSILAHLEQQDQDQTPDEREWAEERDSLFQKTLLISSNPQEAIQQTSFPNLNGKSVLYLPRQGLNDPLFHNRRKLLEACGWRFSFPGDRSPLPSLDWGITPEEMRPGILGHLVRLSPDHTFPIGAVAFRPEEPAPATVQTDPDCMALEETPPDMDQETVLPTTAEEAWDRLWKIPEINAFLEAQRQATPYIPFTPDLTSEQLPEWTSHIVMTDTQLQNDDNKAALNQLMASTAYESGKRPILVLDVGNECVDGVLSALSLPPAVRSLHILNTRGNVHSITADFLSGDLTLEVLEMHLPSLESIGDKFLYNSALKEVALNFPYMTRIGERFLRRADSLESASFYFPKTQSAGEKFLSACPSLLEVTLNLPNLEEIPDDFLLNNHLERLGLNISGATVVGNSFLCGSKHLKEIYGYFAKVQRVKINFLADCRALRMAEVHLPNATKVGDGFIWTNPCLEELKVFLPRATEAGESFLSHNDQAKEMEAYLPRLRKAGAAFLYGAECFKEIDISRMRNLKSLGEHTLWGCPQLQIVTCYNQAQRDLVEQQMLPQTRERVTWRYVIPPDGDDDDDEIGPN